MKTMNCAADVARALDGVLDPPLRSLLADRVLTPGTRIVVVHPRDTLAAVKQELGASIVAHLMSSRAARQAEGGLFVRGVIRHRGGWIEATFTRGVTAFIPDRVDVPPELLIPLMAR